MRILVTAGPTREHIDDVRFISNASSGRMGCAVARAALARGHEVALICGPLEVDPPPCHICRVTSTAEMLHRCCEALPKVDAVVMAAAPADFRPARPVRGKIKKSARPRSLRLVPTPDILRELSKRRKARQVLVGFALEARDLARNARRKLREKGLDLIVANAPEAIAAERASVRIFYPDGAEEAIEDRPKEAIADRLIAIVERLGATRRRTAPCPAGRCQS